MGEIVQSDNEAHVKFKIKYITKYGELTHEPTLNFVRVHNQWKILWDWNYLWPGFTPASKVVVKEKKFSKTGKTIYVVPRLMFDWNKYLDTLSKITGEGSLEIDKRIKSVVPDQYSRCVGYLDPSASKADIDKALSLPGVSLQDIYYPSAQVKYGENPELFYIPAEIYFENDKGEKITILSP